MKKPVLIGVILVAVLVLAGGGIWWSRKSSPQPTTTPTTKKKVEEPLNILPIADRPYLVIEPQADGHNVVIRVVTESQNSTSAEYELEYQAGTLLQGAFGLIKLPSLPSETKILLGSCSAGGACTFHEDVRGGTLLTRWDSPTPYALKSDWKYVDNQAKESAVSSKDAKFQLTAPEIAKARYLVIFNTPGLPQTPKGTVVSDHYSLAASAAFTGQGELTMRASEEGNLSIAGWTGTDWKYYPSQVDGKMVTAQVTLHPLFVVVKN